MIIYFQDIKYPFNNNELSIMIGARNSFFIKLKNEAIAVLAHIA